MSVRGACYETIRESYTTAYEQNTSLTQIRVSLNAMRKIQIQLNANLSMKVYQTTCILLSSLSLLRMLKRIKLYLLKDKGS
jgi:hypothetical protein